MFHSIIIPHVPVEFLSLYNRTTPQRIGDCNISILVYPVPSLKISLLYTYYSSPPSLYGMAEHYQLTIQPPTPVNKYAFGEIEIQIGDNFHIWWKVLFNDYITIGIASLSTWLPGWRISTSASRRWSGVNNQNRDICMEIYRRRSLKRVTFQ